MSYQVLARKWRPRSFEEMAGQEHVLRALINALDHDRLHHAYLFTGTRGVGKTTLARILARCLNCEKGVSSKACGECSACTEIAEGRFIDLIEVDAASRTKVEDTRELLDNVQYLPSRGRYKVYLIDEVHMLSGHSFNALLKTLEEPPPHVKFLLATTDPQKLPVTILSRCLQFNLKNLSPERIVEYLRMVLASENVPVEEAAMWALARAADGSMRDALSLTDQGIAHGNGKLTEAELSVMLGTIDRSTVLDMCRALAERDAVKALQLVEALAEHSPDYGGALAEMLSIWHRVAVIQAVPGALDNSLGDLEVIVELAGKLSREDVQLFYQVCLLGRRDLSLAADPRSGLEMVLLRQLAFQPVLDERLDPPQTVIAVQDGQPNPGSTQTGAPTTVLEKGGIEAVKKSEPGSQAEQAATSVRQPDAVAGALAEYSSVENPLVAVSLMAGGEISAAQRADEAVETDVDTENDEKDNAGDFAALTLLISEIRKDKAAQRGVDAPPGTSQAIDVTALGDRPDDSFDGAVGSVGDVDANSAVTACQHAKGGAAAVDPVVDLEIAPPKLDDAIAGKGMSALTNQSWLQICHQLAIDGRLLNIASNLLLVERKGEQVQFRLDESHSALYDDSHPQRIAQALSDYLCTAVSVAIEIAPVVEETPSLYRLRKLAERQAAAVQALREDPLVKELEQRFGGTLLEQTVTPID